MRSRFLTVFALAGLLSAGMLPLTAAQAAVPQLGAVTAHCVDHSTAAKVESTSSPGTVTVVDTRTGQPIQVVVTISGTSFTVTPVDPAVTLVDASWCVKSSTNVNVGKGTTGASTSTNKNGKVQDISYVVLYSVTSKSPVIIQPCNQATNSGGQGVTTTVHELGRPGPTTFVLAYDTYSIPDQIQVTYEGQTLLDTGLVGQQKSVTVAVPAGKSTQVTVVVTGPYSGTAWTYTVNCPTA